MVVPWLNSTHTSDAVRGATHNAEPNEALLRWNLWVYEPLLLGLCSAWGPTPGARFRLHHDLGWTPLHCAKKTYMSCRSSPNKMFSSPNSNIFFWIRSFNRSQFNVVNPTIIIQNTGLRNCVYPWWDDFWTHPQYPQSRFLTKGWFQGVLPAHGSRSKNRESSFLGPNQSKSQSWHQYLQPRAYGTLFGSWWCDRRDGVAICFFVDL